GPVRSRAVPDPPSRLASRRLAAGCPPCPTPCGWPRRGERDDPDDRAGGLPCQCPPRGAAAARPPGRPARLSAPRDLQADGGRLSRRRLRAVQRLVRRRLPDPPRPLPAGGDDGGALRG